MEIPLRMGRVTSSWNWSDGTENTAVNAEISFMCLFLIWVHLLGLFEENIWVWETMGSNRHMRKCMGIWNQAPLYLNPVLSLATCAVPDKSLYLSEPPFLMFKMALILYKFVVKIRANIYEVCNGAWQNSVCSTNVVVIVTNTIIFMLLKYHQSLDWWILIWYRGIIKQNKSEQW